MATKRTATDSDMEPAPKRNKKPNNHKSRDHQNAHIDPTWGQKYVFSASESATTVPVDSELDFEDDADAMAYLRSVRTQANGIPHLLVAPKIPIGPQLPQDFQNIKREDDEDVENGEDAEEDREIYSSGQGDFRGYYHDGAYTARPAAWDEEPARDAYDEGELQDDEDGYYDPNEDDPTALYEAYFASILSRFHKLRATLHTKPPASAVAALPKTHGHYVGAFGPKSSTFSIWSVRLRTSDPLPAQVASMDKDGVLRVVRVLLGGKFLRRGYDLTERTSRWLWALLARLPERGELNHAEIGWVRDLGRRAVLMMQSLADMARLRDALEGEGMDLGVHDAVDESSDDEDVMREMEVDEKDGEASAPEKSTEQTPQSAQSEAKDPVEPKMQADEGEVEDGEVDDDQKSEPMDVSEDGEVDEGEVPEQPAPAETLEEARARLLAQLETTTAEVPAEVVEVEDDEKRMSDQLRARMNMRATLNMILTVAGEFYGQRDLLEFRDPFTGM
ncbi:hypothetical protein CkaCkLH20_07302 [Colletotrichum karsti]|uniref:V-SNARE n=1 Tax=Colletotrichum karsti TaxID=1095194 RepID=A0A9P6I4T8_9PEZI|nr:uncharacterized protein CkaCkLH20_07302 [Colletotrichum karsti]KAF9875036.1 hypothetical protein CkaCkLH20_07302 [Colletotrichum karsti]